jgi:hypothetical protein
MNPKAEMTETRAISVIGDRSWGVGDKSEIGNLKPET